MRLYDAGLSIIIAVLALTVIGSMAHRVSNKEHHTGKEEFAGHDDAFEESMEVLEAALTGSREDFTPESPEQ